jgi:tetratricopeptide (TPR) repeat protein
MKVRTWVGAGAVALVAIGVPGGLSAQGECKINDSSPFQLQGAKQYIQYAAAARRPDEVPKHLANAIRVLTESPEKIKNEAGRQFLLLRAFAQYLQKEEVEYVMKRGELGYTTDKDGDQNLLLAVDSAATAVERLMPECKSRVAPYRQRFLGDILNKAIEAVRSEQPDTAIYYAQLSLQVAKNDPRPWNVLVSAYQGVQKMDSARIAMAKVIELSGDDSTFTRIKQQSRYNLAVLKLGDAEQKEQDARGPDIAEARALLEAYLKQSPGEPAAAQALGRALRLSGDTTAVAAIYAELIEHPERFTDIQLFEGASNAVASGRGEDAVKIFEHGLAKNPYHRIALLNLSNLLAQQRNHDRMEPFVRRLAEVDPNGQDTWNTIALFWQLKSRAETDPAKKKIEQDSLLAAIKLRDEVNPRVSVSIAGPSGQQFVVQGLVQNEGQAAGTYTMKFEFLDAEGTVVASKEVAIGKLEPGTSTGFDVKVEAPKAIAFRYAPMK